MKSPDVGSFTFKGGVTPVRVTLGCPRPLSRREREAGRRVSNDWSPRALFKRDRVRSQPARRQQSRATVMGRLRATAGESVA